MRPALANAACIPLLAVLAMATGCVGGRETAHAGDRAAATRAAWIERRAAQLHASGVRTSEAAGKAAAEWSSLTGDEREGLILSFNSRERAREEQRRVNAGLDALQRGR